MLQAATLDCEQVARRMAATLQRKAWLVCLPLFEPDGTAWSDSLALHWHAARRGKRRDVRLRYSDVRLAGEGRVLVMVGVVGR